MIRFVNCADWHLRRRNPLMRIDDFYSTVKYKVRWIVQQANMLKAEGITVAGDIFDTTHTSFEVMVDIHRILQRFNGELLAVYGQHDLRYHSYKGRKNTPLSALLATLKNQAPVCERPRVFERDDVKVHVFGCSWGQEIANAPDVDGYKVLLIHRLVVEDAGLWVGHNNYLTARSLLELGYDLIISGDNHQSFSVEENGRWVINVGSMLRLKTSQVNYTPRISVVTFTTNGIEVEWIPLPIKYDVFSTPQEDQSLPANDELVNFILSLREHKFQKPDFERNLQGALVHVEDPAISQMIDEVKERIAKQQAQGEQ